MNDIALSASEVFRSEVALCANDADPIASYLRLATCELSCTTERVIAVVRKFFPQNTPKSTNCSGIFPIHYRAQMRRKKSCDPTKTIFIRFRHFASINKTNLHSSKDGEMSSLLRSTLNTRTLPIGGIKYIRSDAPLCPTDEEIRWLMEHGITTLVDLRSAQEVERKPCPLRNVAGFAYYHLPVTGGAEIPVSREHLYEIYLGMVDEQMDIILETILNATSNVMYFCTAGKDRTGVVPALLLKRLGASDAAIVEDYMKSEENLRDMLASYAKDHPEVDPDILIPREENIRKVLSKF